LDFGVREVASAVQSHGVAGPRPRATDQVTDCGGFHNAHELAGHVLKEKKMQAIKVAPRPRLAGTFAAVCFAAVLIPVLVYASNGPDGDNGPRAVTVKGEVVDLWCYIDHKGHGQKHKSCAVACVEAGNPIGIVDGSGNLYIAMGGKKHQPGREILMDHMADTVTVKGNLIKTGGLQAIYVNSVEK